MNDLTRSVRALAISTVLTACAASHAPPPAAPPPVAPAPVAVVAPPAPEVAPTPTPTPEAATAEPPAGGRMFRGRSEDEWLRLITERPVVRVVERFHSTLYVWHLDLGDGVEISFQPEQEHLETFWKREVTSYHLARLLGIENRVPPTVSKRVPLSIFGRSARGTGLIADRHGMVVGSASVWMPVLRQVHMHEGPARHEWVQWMNPAHPLPEAARERARQVSEVLVFDYLAANYDRWNCCNITADEHNDLVFRDNDAGWYPPVINNLGSPDVVRRVPRYLFETMQHATADALRASVAHDPLAGEVQLVSPSAYTGYERRRAALIANLRRMAERHGQAAVFPWP